MGEVRWEVSQMGGRNFVQLDLIQGSERNARHIVPRPPMYVYCTKQSLYNNAISSPTVQSKSISTSSDPIIPYLSSLLAQS